MATLAVALTATAMAWMTVWAGGPGPVAAGATAQADQSALIDSGGNHTCLITPGGGVACWGANDKGQLGDGTTTFRRSPVMAAGLAAGVRAVATGFAHTCALLDTGAVKCWGDNLYGELGNTTPTGSSTPTDVNGLGGSARWITAGGFHSCAVLDSGEARCWGRNNSGQLGDGTTLDSKAPVSVAAPPTATAVEAGFDSACLLTSTGGVLCWGSNSSGSLGNNSQEDSAAPVPVLGLGQGVSAISLGYKHACALTANRDLQCWGLAGWGQLGVPVNDSHSHVPVNVVAVAGKVATVSAGHSHTCAILIDHSARCWGLNSSGELGNGSTQISGTPVAVSQFDAANISIAAGGSFGEFFTCARSETTIQCWGDNGFGQLAATSTVLTSNIPLAVVLPPARLRFAAAPAGILAGRPFGVQPQVRVEDILGNPALYPDRRVMVTLRVESGPGGLSCAGGLSREDSAGVASFSGCGVDSMGSYRIEASAPPLTSAITTLLALPFRGAIPFLAQDSLAGAPTITPPTATPVPTSTVTPATPTPFPTAPPKHLPSAVVTVVTYEAETGSDSWSDYTYTLKNTGPYDLNMSHLVIQSWYSADATLGGGDDCGAAGHILGPGSIAPGDSVTLSFGANLEPSPQYWPQCVSRMSGYVIVEVHTADPTPLYFTASWWDAYPVVRSH